MARARNIKPGFFTDGALSKVSIPARYLFAALWCMADREGRLVECIEDVEVFAFPRDRVDVEALLCELAPRFITRYEIEGARYIQVNHFGKHQNPHPHEKPSEIPPPDVEHAHEMSRQESDMPLHSTSSPADSLIPDSPIPDSPIPDPGYLILDTYGENGGTGDASAPPPAPESPKAKRSSFKSPTVEEVKAYCVERGNKVDPARFIDFYQANGWKVGKNPMRDWKAAVRTWEARGEDTRVQSGKGGSKGFDPLRLENTPDRYRTKGDDFGAEFMKRLEEKKRAGA